MRTAEWQRTLGDKRFSVRPCSTKAPPLPRRSGQSWVSRVCSRRTSARCEAQVRRAYIQYERLPDALSKNVYLTALHDRNEVLFYRLFSEHLREMIPIVNDLTVGMAMEQYHHECRRPRGVYLSIDHADAIEEAFANSAPGRAIST